MSVFFKGKNLDKINRDTFEAIKHAHKNLTKAELNIRTEKQFRQIQAKFRNGQLSLKKAQEQADLLNRSYHWRLRSLKKRMEDCYKK